MSNVRDRLRATWRVLDLDRYDACVVTGLIGAVIGGAMLSLPWTLVIVGVATIVVGLWAGAR